MEGLNLARTPACRKHSSGAMGKARSKGSMNPAVKNDLRREKVERLRSAGRARGSLPIGFTLPPKGKKKVKQLAKYAGHVARRQAAERAEAIAEAAGMEVERR